MRMMTRCRTCVVQDMVQKGRLGRTGAFVASMGAQALLAPRSRSYKYTDTSGQAAEAAAETSPSDSQTGPHGTALQGKMAVGAAPTGLQHLVGYLPG